MRLLNDRVKAAELLCQKTVSTCQDAASEEASVAVGGASVGAQRVHINPEAVDQCVTNVVNLAKALVTEESRYVVAVSKLVHE